MAGKYQTSDCKGTKPISDFEPDEVQVQHPSASAVFLNGMMAEICPEDIANIMNTQKHMMSRYEKTNEMLLNFNMLSASRYAAMELDFKSHVQILTNTKKELDEIFKRIRSLKTKLGRKYPEAFAACVHVHEIEEDEDEVEDSAAASERPVSSDSTVQ